MHKSTFYHGPIAQFVNKLGTLRFDSVFVPSSQLETEVPEVVKHLPDTKIFTKLDVFGGKHLLDLFPDAQSVEVAGRVTAGDEYVGLCPTHPKLRSYCIDVAKSLIEKNVDGIWLDNIRYPTNWESENCEILDTCYCDRCLSLFEDYIGEPIAGTTLEDKFLHIDGSYYHEWLEFKALQITSIVSEIKNNIKLSGKNITLGMFVVPWEDKDYGAGIKRIVAQDLGKLIELVDIFSPMLFFQSLGKSPKWIEEMLEYYWTLGINFWPSIKILSVDTSNLADIKEAIRLVCRESSKGFIVGLPKGLFTTDGNIDELFKKD